VERRKTGVVRRGDAGCRRRFCDERREARKAPGERSRGGAS
jgi:hypothetical protein